MFRALYPRTPILWLDAGGFSGDGSVAGRMQTETLIDGMNRLGYTAANVTDRELIAGFDEFLKLARTAAFSFISANVIYQDSGRPALAPFTIKQIPADSWRGDEPLRVGILGLARENPEFLQSTLEGRRIVIEDPILAAGRMLPVLRREADVVVVLTNMESSEVYRLTRAVPGIDLVAAGNGRRVSDNQAVPPSTRVLYSGTQGKRLGEVRLFLGRAGLASTSATHIFLDRRYPADPETHEREILANQRINDHYRKEALERPVTVATNLPASATYVGADACRSCHEEDYTIWAASGHHHAIRTLEEAGQEFSPLCVRCHVTGFRRGNGFQNLIATPKFADVQCEACHGPAGAHLEDYSAPYGQTDASDCLACHTQENSPDYEHAPYWESIAH